MQHIIVTRFNCKFGPDRQSFPGFDSNSPEWLDGRFKLFERYCAPTVLAQTVSDFTWFIYFDRETPQAYLDRARALVSGHSQVRIKLCDAFSIELLKDDIRRDVPPSCTWLLTTRLDNDDGLRSDFIEKLQAEARQNRKEALNFPIGIVLGTDRLYRSKQPSNAFISMSEPYGRDFMTVHSGNHNNMAARVPVRDIGGGEPAWLQVVHGANVSNKLRGYRIPFRDGCKGFVPLETFDSVARRRESPLRIKLENALISNVWSLRDLAAQSYRRVRATAARS